MLVPLALKKLKIKGKKLMDSNSAENTVHHQWISFLTTNTNQAKGKFC